MARLIDELGSRVLVLDGGMGTGVQAFDLTVEEDFAGCENCTDVLTRTRPDVIEAIHRGFFEAGADAVETNTFGAFRHVLDDYGIGDEAAALCRASAELARSVADAFTTADRPRYVIGSMGPGTKLISLGQIGWDEMLASYRASMRGLIAGGVDAILIETCQDLLQVKCAIRAALGALEDEGRSPADCPVMVSITIEQTGTMLLGTSVEAAIEALRGFPIASLGLNCATGPDAMEGSIRTLASRWDRPITCFPNAGLPVLKDGRAVYPLGPEALGEAMAGFVRRHGVSLVGGCCGTTPAHIAAVARAVEGLSPGDRGKASWSASSTSLFSAVPHRQETSFLIVGERCNASGSRRFRRLLEAEDWDAVVSLARGQVRDGSHVLDVNVDVAGRDNAHDMARIVSRLSRQVDAPLMIDSTQPATIESALEHAGGRCIINSANFEEGEGKFDEICSLAVRFNAALVIGTIDEDEHAAMARTAERKLQIARRGIERAVSVHGLDEADLFIDPLVLPISTGMDADRRSALELIEGTRRIARAFPRVQLVCGLSNASFGLKPAARVVLNSVLLGELTAAGMTAAIVHAGGIEPMHRIDDERRRAALDLIYDRRDPSAGGTGLPEGIDDTGFDPLSCFIALFEDSDGEPARKAAAADEPVEARLRRHIIDGEKEGLEAALDEALERYSPIEIINGHLLDGMKTVGELFGSGEMQLPFVLQSAEVMKKAVAHLEPRMERKAGETKGSIVLATVKGDVHDIGKNLVDIILTNNGYTVHNIGIKQTVDAILDAFDRHKPDAIGLSGLLVKSVMAMEENIETMNARGVTPPLLLGGAALSRRYAEGRLREKYRGPLLYGKDAFEGLRIMDGIADGRLDELTAEIEARAARYTQPDGEPAGEQDPPPPDAPAAQRDADVPAAPFFGSRVVDDIAMEEVFAYINPVALFRVQWQFRRGKRSKADFEREIEEKAVPIFERLKARCIEEGLLEPRVVYGYAPVWSEGNDVVVFDAEDQSREIARFSFPRQRGGKRLCIADFFRDEAGCRRLGRKDVLGLSCVTVGRRIGEVCRALFEGDEYTEYLYMHGIGVESAEALAELQHKRMRAELGIDGDDSPGIEGLFAQKYRGSRYSFGYPACPELRDQEILWSLLDPGRIGCTLTENWQIEPEQSTSAIVVHHPAARYFGV